MELTCVDLMYLAWNRLEFTRESFTCLLANTDWRFVRTLFVYDDGSTDGACDWLTEAIKQAPVPVRFHRTRIGSPVTLFVDFVDASSAPIMAKCDSDAVYPPGWLQQSLDVFDRHPDLDLLGIEAMNPVSVDADTVRSYTPAEFISGLGLYKRRVFARSRPKAYNKYFGLEEWQVAQGPGLKRGWINPALPVFLLDRMPTEPWRSLSAEYVARGWQRAWPRYDTSADLWRWRWPDGATEARSESTQPAPATPAQSMGTSAAAIASPRRLNLACLEPHRTGFDNAGLYAVPHVEVIDLKTVWPWPDSQFDHVRCWDLLPRLPDKIGAMNELWRVTRPSGTVEIGLPTTDGPGAFADPTYVSFWNQRSFAYFEAGNPYRERFARKYGIHAAWRIIDQRTESSADGPRLVMLLQAIKPGESAVERSATTAASHHAAPYMLGAMRIKNESAHIREVLERTLAVCERVLVFDDNSDDDTVAICRSFGDRVHVIPSPYTGLDEVRDKNYLLARVIAEAPEWVLWIDGDEVPEVSSAQRLREATARAGNTAAFALRIAFLWDGPRQVRSDGIWGRFTRPSLFRLRGQPLQKLHFAATGFGGNFHCGNVPRGLVGETRPLDVRLKHYGYETRAQRMAKYDWYRTHDPNNSLEDNYRHLADIPGARHAPGPPLLYPWSE